MSLWQLEHAIKDCVNQKWLWTKENINQMIQQYRKQMIFSTEGMIYIKWSNFDQVFLRVLHLIPFSTLLTYSCQFENDIF